jgi:hypothetical protein
MWLETFGDKISNSKLERTWADQAVGHEHFTVLFLPSNRGEDLHSDEQSATCSCVGRVLLVQAESQAIIRMTSWCSMCPTVAS